MAKRLKGFFLGGLAFFWGLGGLSVFVRGFDAFRVLELGAQGLALRILAEPRSEIRTLWYFTVTLDPYLFWVYWPSEVGLTK